MRKRLSYILILVVLLVNGSCLDWQFIKGRAELLSISDSALNDSAIFVGHVHWVNLTGNYPQYENQFKVWIENTKFTTTTDSNGYYFLKTIPGTYSVMCHTMSNEWVQLIEEKRNIKIDKNKKIQIDFYIGYTIE